MLNGQNSPLWVATRRAYTKRVRRRACADRRRTGDEEAGRRVIWKIVKK
jgi:ferric iron reductase protein FhuF